MMETPRFKIGTIMNMSRPIGRLGLLLMMVAITTAPAVLFFDPAPLWPGHGHVPRDPMSTYTLSGNDVAYVGSSRTWDRALSSLFVPHDMNIEPAWRVLTWALTAWAGKLERLPDVLAIASYSILVAVMLLIGRLVARETGQAVVGLVSMIMVGTTSLMITPVTWYSAGKALWAGFGILATLWYAQTYRRGGRPAALVFAMISTALAGWFGTIGHLAGPVAAIYLWADGRRRCRIAAAWPVAVSAIAVTLSLAIAYSRFDTNNKSHGHSVREFIRPVHGLLRTVQSIPENLAFGNLGLAVETTPAQGALLTLGLAGFWISRLSLRGRYSGLKANQSRPFGVARALHLGISPLERAGIALVVGCYLGEWTFGPATEHRTFRTYNLHFVFPEFHAIPQIGAVLWLVGWWSEMMSATLESPLATKLKPLTRRGSLGLGLLILAMLLLHRPRVDFLVRASVPPMLPSEQERFPVLPLQMMRANIVLLNRAVWQRSTLRRLDRAQEIANRSGLGQDAMRTAFGHRYLPASVDSLEPDSHGDCDMVGLLDISDRGRADIPISARNELTQLFAEVKEPRPEWLAADETWPPQVKNRIENQARAPQATSP